MDRNKKTLSMSTLFILAVTALLHSCLPPETNSVSRSNQTSTNVSVPETSEPKNSPSPASQNSSVNYFQNGNTKASNNFLLDINSQNTVFLRGNEINNFITYGNENINSCLLISFDSDVVKKVLLVAAAPKSYRNFSENTIEFYYTLSPQDSVFNKSHCQGAGVIAKVFSEYKGKSIVFSLADVCTDCFNTTIKSSIVDLITKEGKDIPSIKDQYLGISLYSTPQSEVVFGNSCSTSSDCTKKGYDCCSLGQCVNDKTPKPGVAEINPQTGELFNFSPQYIQVKTDIEENPSHIYNYPHLFYLCSQSQDSDFNVVQEHNEEEKAYLRLRELRDLYQCTTTIQGEQSICIKRYIAPTTRSIELITGKDDMTFEGTYSGTKGMPNHSITKIIHAEETLFNNNEILVPGSVGINGGVDQINRGNNNFDDVTTITLDHPLSANSEQVDEIAIYYRIDGSCEYINDYLARCKKYYTQGQNIGETTDHYPASNYFKLPFYADTSRLFTVKVDDVPKIESMDWEDYIDSDHFIRFFKNTNSGKDYATLQVFDGQKIEIQFYVDLNQHKVATSKYEALNRIDEICQCGGPYCTLAEVKGTSGNVIDYKCVYPQEENFLRFEQKVIVSSKSVPQRYFDEDGISHDKISINTPKQEESNKDSIYFKYINNDPVRPNNTDNYIGFNEINGTISYDTSSAHPPTVVELEKGVMYDIFVDQGTFNTCISCGSDYYSRFIKTFPDSYFNLGAGYQSKGVETDPFANTDYRMDDLLFGRACFIPATMIPFTHSDDSLAQDQRFARQAAQHFLFANGYQRDWYGFNYGSIIGSFDGVTWFSVGSQRRIKADSHRLYLAVNSYFGDLNRSNVFVVHVNEASLIVGAGSQVTSDDQSNGASCRQYHQCEVDRDCVTQLGWEYTCENIGQLSTTWPDFNSYGDELPTNDPIRRLFKNIFYGDGIGKRCVYRGRGAPCERIKTKEGDNTYSSIDVSSALGIHMCAPNYHCAEINNNDYFNNKVSRFARDPAYQNASTFVQEEELDLIGKAARLLGRPYKYNGDEEIFMPEAFQNLRSNNVSAICIPGKEPRSSEYSGNTFFAQHTFTPDSPASTDPSEFFMGDQINGIGMTNNTATKHEENYISCGIFDNDGDYFYKDSALNNQPSSFTDEVKLASVAQATTTNMLKIFEGPDYADTTFIRNFETEFIEEFSYQKNRCLRMPGSPCFSNLDCAMNEKITNLTQVIGTSTDDSLTGDDNLNRYEVAFWQSEMICAQRLPKDHEDYTLQENRCCRPHDQTFLWAQEAQQKDRVSSADEPNLIKTNVPGFDLDMSSKERLTQVAMYKDFLEDNPNHLGATYPSTQGCEDGNCGCKNVSGSGLSKGCFSIEDSENKHKNQWKTLQRMGRKMCCSENWIRNYHTDLGGGHEWTIDKKQLIPSENFKQINWTKKEEEQLEDTEFSCTGFNRVTDPDCKLRGLNDSTLEAYEDFLSRFDLLGIPQIPIPQIKATLPGTYVLVDDQQDEVGPGSTPIPGTIKYRNSTNQKNTSSFRHNSNGEYYISADASLDIWADEHSLKKIYSRDEFSCCLPPNAVIERDGDPGQCCSGYAEDIFNGEKIERTCKLNDLTDISQLLNKFVSSLGEEIGLEENNFDPITGAVDHDKVSKSTLMRLICEADICGSRVVASGVAYGLYTTPGIDDPTSVSLRFIQSENEREVGGLYEAGLKWRNHLYCFPMERNTQNLGGSSASGDNNFTQASCDPTTQSSNNSTPGSPQLDLPNGIPAQLELLRCDCI